MTLEKMVLKTIVILACVLGCLAMAGLPVYAATPQENPDTAKVDFSGLSLFQLYSGTLDSVLTKNQQEIQTNIEKSPFANVPLGIADSFHNFLSSSNNICNLVLGLDISVSDTTLLLEEFRYQDAATLNSTAFNNLASAQQNINTLQQATDIAGNQFQISGMSGDIKTSYLTVLDKIQRLSNLLDLYRSILEEQRTEIQNGKLLPSSDISLEINPKEAYVGDYVIVEGTLSAKGIALSGRQVEILLNGSQYLDVITDAQGQYRGSLQIPDLNMPIMQIQSIYYPQASDAGNNALAISPSISLKVLYYEVVLTIKTDTNAYPGRETIITGLFDYGSSPVAATRKIEISLDNAPVKESEVTAAFAEQIMLPVDLETGNHLITVSVSATGRYAPEIIDVQLNVAKPIPVALTTNLPSVVFIPGSFSLRGKLDSEIGAVTQARVTITFAGKPMDVVSNSDGTFRASTRNNMSFGLFGSQSLEIEVMPTEPWQTTLTTAHKIITIYIVNCVVFFGILIFLGIILPRRFKFGYLFSFKRKLPQTVTIAQQGLSPASVTLAANKPSPENENHNQLSPDSRLFYWYRIVIQLVQKVSGILMKPNQTLREYVNDRRNATGAASKPILEFTRMIERVLYSPHQVTADDVKNGEQLARNVQKSIKK